VVIGQRVLIADGAMGSTDALTAQHPEAKYFST
jgi:hypothetical protein